MWPDQENLKLQEFVIELPVTTGAKPREVVQGVHNRDRRIERERRQRAFVTDLDVLIVPAADAPVGKGREVLTPSVLPQASVPTSAMIGFICDGTDRLGSVKAVVGSVFRAILVPSRNETPTHRTAAAKSAL